MLNFLLECATSKAAVLLLAVVAVITTACHAGDGGQNEPEQENGASPVASEHAPTTVAPQSIDESLVETLDKKIDVTYVRDYLWEVLADLRRRVGLHSAFPSTINNTFVFTLKPLIALSKDMDANVRLMTARL